LNLFKNCQGQVCKKLPLPDTPFTTLHARNILSAQSQAKTFPAKDSEPSLKNKQDIDLNYKNKAIFKLEIKGVRGFFFNVQIFI